MNTVASLVEIEADLVVTPEKGLRLTYQVSNAGRRHVYVYDRLWTLDKKCQIVVDPKEAYRYLVDGIYRIHLGSAPLPRSKTTFLRNAPYATYVPPGGKVSRTFEMNPPWHEYNFYFEVPGQLSERKVDAKGVEVVIDFLESDQPVATEPAAIGPECVKVLDLGLADRVVRWRSSQAPILLDVIQRFDEFERLEIPSV